MKQTLLFIASMLSLSISFNVNAQSVPAIGEDLQAIKQIELLMTQIEDLKKTQALRKQLQQQYDDAKRLQQQDENKTAAPNTPADNTQVVEVKASNKINSLHLRAVMTFPARLKNVSDTANYLLEPINYKVMQMPGDRKISKILSRPLLPIYNNGQMKTIEDALLDIAGDDTILVVDHEHKLITFEFAPAPEAK